MYRTGLWRKCLILGERFSVYFCIYTSAYAISGHRYVWTCPTDDLHENFHEHIGSIRDHIIISFIKETHLEVV